MRYKFERVANLKGHSLMQMEVGVTAPVAGKVAALRVEAGHLSQMGDVLAVIVPAAAAC